MTDNTPSMAMKQGPSSTPSLIEKIRTVIWPIYGYENKKFIPMALMMMCILFNYSIVRVAKDSQLITSAGAEIISTAKLWGVLPSAIIFMLGYSALTNVLSKQKLFYLITSIFIGFFGAYFLFLYPYHEALTPDMTDFITSYPRLKWPAMMIQYWIYTLFYIMAELWGSVMVSLMFWQFANQITDLKEAKRFYGMFGLIGNFGLILAGHFGHTAASFAEVYSPENVWSLNISIICGGFITSCAIILFLYWWTQTYVLTDKRCYNPEAQVKKGKKKAKLSLGESFKYIFTSPYLGFIALLIISYGISIILVENVWKSQLRLLFPEKSDYSRFMSQFQIYTGYATILCMLIGANILRIFSWRFSALLTPIIILLTGAAFFAFIIFKDKLEPNLIAFGTTAVMAAAYAGMIQNILSKSVKYSIFDATKEMTYIPLDEELKVKGKAAVDVIGGRLGKSGGAWVVYILLTLWPNADLVSLTPEIGIAFLIIMAIWFMAVFALNKRFLAISNQETTA